MSPIGIRPKMHKVESRSLMPVCVQHGYHLRMLVLTLYPAHRP